jgi:hypothetical protein
MVLLALKLSALMLIAAPRPAYAVLEAPADDPIALALGGVQPAWPAAARLPADGASVIEGPSASGVAAVTAQREAIPDLRSPAALAWCVVRGWRFAARLQSRSLADYRESELALDLGRPSSRDRHWGWALTLGAGQWSIAPQAAAPPGEAGGVGEGGGSGGWLAGFAVGGRIGDGLTLAARWLERGGALGEVAPGRIELGATIRLLPAWRAGIGLDSSGSDEAWRLQAGIAWRAAPAFVVRAGFRPAEGTTSLGAGFGVRGLHLDLGRRLDPRLGATTALALAIGGGRDPMDGGSDDAR